MLTHRILAQSLVGLSSRLAVLLANGHCDRFGSRFLEICKARKVC